MPKATESCKACGFRVLFEIIDPETRNTCCAHLNKRSHLFGVFGYQLFYIFYNFLSRQSFLFRTGNPFVV